MKKNLLTFFLILLLGTQLTANDFIYDRDKIDPGTMYIYKHSDFSGNEPHYEYVYIKDYDMVETLRDYYILGDGLWLIKERISVKYFMFDTMEFQTVLPTSDTYTKLYKADYDFSNRKYSWFSDKLDKGKPIKKEGFGNIEKDAFYPFYHAANNIPDLNIFGRFLNLEKKGVKIGINDVWDKTDVYTLVYDRYEKINGVICVKYNLTRKGVFSKVLKKEGAIWFKKGDSKQIMVKYKLNQRISWTKKNEMAVLEESRNLTYDQWQQFIQDKKRELDQELEF